MTGYILVPLDGSALAESALPLNIALARLTSSGITLLRTVPAPATFEPPIGAITPAGSLSEIWGEGLSVARDYLYNVGKHIEENGLQVRTEIVEDASATAIVEYAAQNVGVWLIAMAARHSPSGPWAFGSVVERVLHAAHKPVLLTRPSIEAFPRNGLKEETGEHILADSVFHEPAFHTIIVPLDGSRLAEEALEPARRLALLTGATLALICAIPPPDNGDIDQVELVRISVDIARGYAEARLAHYLANTAEYLRAEGVQVRTELVYGHPAEMILLTARRLHGDLIVIAAHGRRDLERVWLGSIAQKVVQGSTLPVLLIRASGRQEGATALIADS